MSRRRYRRQTRVFALRGKRTVTRHYLSILSAVVLWLALTVALTDGRLAPHDGGPQAGEASSRVSAAAPLAYLPSAPPQTGWVIYYIVESLEQMNSLGTVIRGESVYRDVEGAPPTAVYFLIFDTPEQEAAGARLIAHVVDLAPLQGFNLNVIDLTQ